jgi:tetratricopeptide (TPR) repeat protein
LPELVEDMEMALASAPFDSALPFAARALECYPKSVEAMELAGRIYARGDHPSYRRRAEFAFLRALRQDPDRNSTLREFALLRERQEFHRGAADIWRQLAAVHPEAAEPLLRLGSYYEWRSRVATQAEDIVAQRNRAKDYYQQALVHEPDNSEALLRLATVDLIAEDRPAAITALKRLLRIRPAHREGRLLYAYSLACAGRDSLAWEMFQCVLGGVGLEKLDDPGPFLKLGEWPESGWTADSLRIIRRFWALRDPLWITPCNERLLEHRRRAVWLRNLSPPGFESGAPAEAVLRFGPPLRIHRTIEFNLYELRPGDQFETLLFPGLSLTFQGLVKNKLFLLDSGSAKRMAAFMVQRPEIFSPARPLEPIEMPLELWALRGATPGRVGMIAAFAPPPEFQDRWRRTEERCTIGLFFIDPLGQWAFRDVRWRSAACARALTDDFAAGIWTRIELDTSDYLAGVELLPESGDRIGMTRRDYRPPDLWRSGLVISDLVIGACDAELTAGTFEARAEIGAGTIPAGLLPQGSNTFFAGDHVGCYLEIYGLSANAEGQRGYELTLTLGKERIGQKHNLFRRLAATLGFGLERASVVLREEAWGIRADEARLFLLQLDTERVGKRWMTVGIRDLVSGAETHRSVQLLIQADTEPGRGAATAPDNRRSS